MAFSSFHLLIRRVFETLSLWCHDLHSARLSNTIRSTARSTSLDVHGAPSQAAVRFDGHRGQPFGSGRGAGRNNHSVLGLSTSQELVQVARSVNMDAG